MIFKQNFQQRPQLDGTARNFPTSKCPTSQSAPSGRSLTKALSVAGPVCWYLCGGGMLMGYQGVPISKGAAWLRVLCWGSGKPPGKARAAWEERASAFWFCLRKGSGSTCPPSPQLVAAGTCPSPGSYRNKRLFCIFFKM